MFYNIVALSNSLVMATADYRYISPDNGLFKWSVAINYIIEGHYVQSLYQFFFSHPNQC